LQDFDNSGKIVPRFPVVRLEWIMEERVIGLEADTEQLQRRNDALAKSLQRLEDTNSHIFERLDLLPTRSDLYTFTWHWAGLALAVVALTVGGIAGGLSLIASAN
jgi:hypothetical protein